MRQVRLDNKQLIKILKDREVEFKKAQELQTTAEKINKELTALGYKMNRLKEKTSQVLNKENIELSDFEIITEVKLEKGEPILEIVDQVEEYKKLILKKKADEKK